MFGKTPLTRALRHTIIAAALLGLVACGGEASARDEAVDRMVDEGMGRDVAECIVDSVADELGDDALAENFEPSQDQMTLIFDLTDTCLFGE